MLLCVEGHARPMTGLREVGSMLRWWGEGHGGVASAIGRGVWLSGCMSPQIRGMGARWLRFGSSRGRVEVYCTRGVNEEKWPPPMIQKTCTSCPPLMATNKLDPLLEPCDHASSSNRKT